jgi:hypothetical protein
MLNVVATGVVGDQAGAHAVEGLPEELLVSSSSFSFFVELDCTDGVELEELFRRGAADADFLKLEAVSSWRK